jgi:hypothetical protein
MSLKDIQNALADEGSNLATIKDKIGSLIDGNGSGPGSALSGISVREHFKIFRDYVEHEDNLINSRLMWNITIQGFLFATYGLSVQKLAEQQATGAGVPALRWLILILPLFGIGISLVSIMGVIAARTAINSLVVQWKEILDQAGSKEPGLPFLVGGGIPDGDKSGTECSKAHRRGLRAPLWFPWIFVFAWAALFLQYLLHYLLHLGA